MECIAIKEHNHQDWGVTLRVLAVRDVQEVAALHREIRQSLPDSSFLYAQGPEFFERLIVSEGVVVGAFRDGRLVGYGAVILPGAQLLARAYALTHLNIDSSVLAFGSGCGVHPDHRREGLFRRLIAARTREAFLRGCSHITAVVSPLNDVSLRALHSLGHAAVGLHHDEDGENFLLVQRTEGCFPPLKTATVPVPLVDVDENFRILKDKPSVGLPVYLDGQPAFAYAEAGLFCASRPASG
jgi:GNAT superfamily N-acetyltransferase